MSCTTESAAPTIIFLLVGEGHHPGGHPTPGYKEESFSSDLSKATQKGYTAHQDKFDPKRPVALASIRVFR